MTYDKLIDSMVKRVRHGLSIKNLTKDPKNERLCMALKAYELQQLFPDVSARYIVRSVHLVWKKVQPDKAVMASIVDIYTQMVAAFGDTPIPKLETGINNILHDRMVENIKRRNDLIQLAKDIDGQINSNDLKFALQSANETARQFILDVQEEKKRKATERKQQELQEEKDRRAKVAKDLHREITPTAQKAKKAPIDRPIKNGGYKLPQADTDTRRMASEELNRKVHELYRQKYGEDAVHIPRAIRIELMQGMAEETKQRYNEEMRELTRQKKQTIEEQSLAYVVHKVRLAPNKFQQSYFQKCFGVRRFCYNWAYDQWMAARQKGERIFPSELSKQFGQIAKEQYPFVYQVTHFAKTSGFDAFDAAIQSLFDGRGFPQRKRRKLGGSFSYVVTNKRKQPMLSDFNPDVPDSKPSKKRQYLLIPTFGYVKMMERLRFDGILTGVTIKQEGDGKYYACLKVCVSREEWHNTHPICDTYSEQPIGIDLGLSTLATLSNGLKIDARKEDPKTYSNMKRLQYHIKQLHLAHPRHTTKHQKRLKVQLGKVKTKLRHQREDFLHKLTTAIAYHYKYISIEELNIQPMLKEEPAVAAKIINSSFYKLRLMLEQKMPLADHHLHKAEKFMPSTRLCSVCGHIEDGVALKERTYHCPKCGATIDRDINAAVNLARLIGLGNPDLHSADKGVLTAILTRNGIKAHQAVQESR